MTPDIEFIDPIESTNTYEWRCRRCGDYIISRRRPKCENCDPVEEATPPALSGRDILPLQEHERVNR